MTFAAHRGVVGFLFSFLSFFFVFVKALADFGTEIEHFNMQRRK